MVLHFLLDHSAREQNDKIVEEKGYSGLPAAAGLQKYNTSSCRGNEIKTEQIYNR